MRSAHPAVAAAEDVLRGGGFLTCRTGTLPSRKLAPVTSWPWFRLPGSQAGDTTLRLQIQPERSDPLGEDAVAGTRRRRRDMICGKVPGRGRIPWLDEEGERAGGEGVDGSGAGPPNGACKARTLCLLTSLNAWQTPCYIRHVYMVLVSRISWCIQLCTS